MDRLAWVDLGKRPVWFPAACALTGAASFGTTPRNAIAFLGASGALAALAVLLRSRSGAHLLTLVSFFLLGAGMARWTRAPTSLEFPRAALLEGEVRSVRDGPDSTGLVLEVARSEEAPALEGHAVSLWAQGEVPVVPGQRVLLPAKLKPVPPPANPGERDRQEATARQGVVATGGFSGPALVVLSKPSPWRLALARLHQRLRAAITPLPGSDEGREVLLTLAAGERGQVSPTLQADFAASGLAHVLSISGLHVAVIALFVLFTLRRLLARLLRRWRTFDARRAAALLAIPSVWGYVVFTGSAPPAVRAGVMATCAFLGLAVWRRADPLNALGWAVLAMVVAVPSDVASLSFQLSAGAVVSLILISPAVRASVPLCPPDPSRHTGWRLRAARMAEGALQTFCASLAVTVASAPLLANAFHRLSLAGLVSNIVCLPAASLLTVIAAAGTALFCVAPPLGLLVLRIGLWGAGAFVWAVHLFAGMPGASVDVPHFGLWALPFEAGLLLWALGRGRVRWSGLAVPLSAVGVMAVAWLPSPGLTVTFLSVGHGDAIVLRSGHQAALVDGGGVPRGADTGARYVIPYLKDVGIGRLSLAVLSHPHPDHALGLASTLASVPTDRLWLGADEHDGPLTRLVIAAAGKDAQVERVEAGHLPFRLGEATLEVLGPPRDRELLSGVNDRSVVLRVRHGDVTFLLSGDIEADAEETLDPGAVTVMKAPHHGSRTSSSPAFLARTHPRFVVFCVGIEDRFGAPSPEVVDRYAALGARCFRTDRDGAVEVHSDGHHVQVRTFRPSVPAPPPCQSGPRCRPLARNDP
jgi:competence protein ComEC